MTVSLHLSAALTGLGHGEVRPAAGVWFTVALQTGSGGQSWALEHLPMSTRAMSSDSVEVTPSPFHR